MSSSHDQVVHRIRNYLGKDAIAGGPFALLGVQYESIESYILRARDRRLAQIDRHPHSRTPDADEVRMAVHAACSQLLDLQLREQLQSRWPEGVAQRSPPAWHSRRATRLPDSILHSARMTIAACGGWNPRARRRLVLLAKMYRVSAIDIIRSLGTPNGSTVTSHNQHPKPPRVRPLPLPESSAGVWVLVYGLLVGMVVLLGVQTFIRFSSSELPTAIESPQATVDTISSQESSLEDAPRHNQRTPRSIRHYSALLHEIEQGELLASTDPLSAAQLVADYMPPFFSQWMSFPHDDLEAFVAHLVAIDTMTQDNPQANRIFTSALSAGVSLEKPLQAAPSLSVRRFLSMPGEDRDSFANTMSLVLQQLASESRTDDPVWWDAWIQAVQSIHEEDMQKSSKLVLAAMSSRLRASSSSVSWSKTAGLLSNALTWRSGSPERVWMLGVLTDPSYDTWRVAALTEAIATHSSASGVGVAMILSKDASMSDRYALADEYRSVWIAGSETDLFLDRLSDELLAATSLTGPMLDVDAAQQRLQQLARLNAVCWMHWHGDDAQAQIVLYADPSNSQSSSSDSDLFAQGASDDRIALLLVNASKSDAEMNVLAQIQPGTSIGLNTAHALVRMTGSGSARESRDAAEQVIKAHADELAVLIALDRYLLTKRVSGRFRDLLRSILSLDTDNADDQWNRRAHDALLVAISTAASARQDSDSVVLVKELTASYAMRRITNVQSVQGLTRITADLLVEVGAAALGSGASIESIEDIMSMHRVRIERANNQAQRFAADQWSLVQLQSLYTQLTITGSSSQVEQVTLELQDRMRQAITVDDQNAQLERAQAQLWLIFFREGRL
ncbi:MAG: hypothetical protein JKY96_01000 [Phycisphaerales bacterium]|nr:hypothetical protein [Phycisphaerales bacterium]